MPRKTTNTLSAAFLADVREATRRTLAQGTPGGCDRPFGESPSGNLWFVIDGDADDGTNVGRRNYTGKLYASITATSPVSGTAVKARNSYEAKNTTSVRAGYTVHPGSTTCGDITGIEVAPKAVVYPVIDRVKIDSDWYYVFAHRNDPIIYVNPS